jgi:hypothetical protein
VQCGSYPWRRIILPHLENTPSSLDTVPGTPAGDEGARQGGIREKDRRASSSTPRVPEGVIAHRFAPQFSTSHALIPSRRYPSPSGGMPMRTRTGKRRPASAIMKAELAAIELFPFCSQGGFRISLLRKSSFVGPPTPAGLPGEGTVDAFVLSRRPRAPIRDQAAVPGWIEAADEVSASLSSLARREARRASLGRR